MHGVFGVVMTQHARRMAIQRPLDLEGKLLESPSVATPRAIEERIARSPDVRPHQRTFACSQLLL
ncbi:MAG: hypothetical protein M3547_13005 [Acidobacteriota bacterium]|nr:hypothetical protein [Acidobacteriota bacterium]